MEHRYRIEQGNIVKDSAVIQQLWADGFATLHGAVAQQKLASQYQANPAGTGLSYLLYEIESNQAVGVQSLVQRRFYCGETPLLAGTLADYVVTAKHRSLGPALMLMRECLEGGRTTFDFLYGFPNKKAEIIVKRVGLEFLGDSVRYVKLLSSNDFLKKKLPHWLARVAAPLLNTWLRLADGAAYNLSRKYVRGEEVGDFNAEFDRLCDSTVAPLLVSDRSSALLHWRYPLANGRRIFTIRQRRDDALAGYLIWSQRDDTAIVHDFYCRAAADIEMLFNQFSRHSRHHSLVSIVVEFFGPQRVVKALRKTGFIARDSSVVYFMAGKYNPAKNPEHWYLTGFDRDSD